jgi:hypothetical protein
MRRTRRKSARGFQAYGVLARTVLPDGKFISVGMVIVVGGVFYSWHAEGEQVHAARVRPKHAYAFGAGMVQQQRRLQIAVIGYSNTASPVIKQLAWLGSASSGLMLSRVTRRMVMSF